MARHFLIADAKRALSSEIYKWRRDAIAQHIEKIKTLFPLVTERLDSLVALIKKKFTKSKKTLMDNIEEIKTYKNARRWGPLLELMQTNEALVHAIWMWLYEDRTSTDRQYREFNKILYGACFTQGMNDLNRHLERNPMIKLSQGMKINYVKQLMREEHCSPKVKTAKDSKDEDLRQVFRRTIFSDPIGQPSTSKIIKQPSTSKIIVQPSTERSTTMTVDETQEVEQDYDLAEDVIQVESSDSCETSKLVNADRQESCPDTPSSLIYVRPTPHSLIHVRPTSASVSVPSTPKTKTKSRPQTSFPRSSTFKSSVPSEATSGGSPEDSDAEDNRCPTCRSTRDTDEDLLSAKNVEIMQLRATVENYQKCLSVIKKNVSQLLSPHDLGITATTNKNTLLRDIDILLKSLEADIDKDVCEIQKKDEEKQMLRELVKELKQERQKLKQKNRSLQYELTEEVKQHKKDIQDIKSDMTRMQSKHEHTVKKLIEEFRQHNMRMEQMKTNSPYRNRAQSARYVPNNHEEFAMPANDSNVTEDTRNSASDSDNDMASRPSSSMSRPRSSRQEAVLNITHDEAEQTPSTSQQTLEQPPTQISREKSWNQLSGARSRSATAERSTNNTCASADSDTTDDPGYVSHRSSTRPHTATSMTSRRSQPKDELINTRSDKLKRITRK